MGSPDLGGREVETAPERATALVEPPVDAAAPAPPAGEREALASAPHPVAPAPAAEAKPSKAPPAKTATLEVVFLRDDQAAPGVTAWLVHHPTLANTLLGMLDAHYTVPADAPREVSTPSGAAMFTGLRAGHRYYLAYATEPRAAQPSRLSPNELHAGYAYEVRLGSGVVQGHVFDPSGRPRVGVGVQVALSAPDPQSKLMDRAMTVTDERGAYRIDSLRATDYAVVMEPDCRFDGHGEVEEQRVRLAEGEVREVDFGSALPGTRWTGRVLNAFGEPFVGRPRLALERADDSQGRITVVGVDGQFELTFTPGTWRVSVFATGCPDTGFQLGTVDLPNSDVARDIVVPGTRVHGRVLPVEAGQVVDSDLLISMYPQGHQYPAAFRTVNVMEGRYSIDGLEPGVWVASTWPGRLAELVEIVIVEGMVAVERDLRWTVE
jgi:hypothetical protein